MRGKPIITRIEVDEFADQLQDVGLDPTGAIPTYSPGSTYTRHLGAIRVFTDVGLAVLC
jgi:hypothetical protein